MSQPAPPGDPGAEPAVGPSLANGWSHLSQTDRGALGGAALAAAGSLIVIGGNGRNANGMLGASPVVLLLAVVAAAGWWWVRRGAARSDAGGPIVVAAALGVAVLVGLELLETLRTGLATDRLGIAALIGRVVAAGGGVLLIAAVVAWRRLPLRMPAGGRLLAATGALTVALGWLLLIGVADDFAMRVLDAAGIAAAVGVLIIALALPEDRRSRWALTIAAAVVVFGGADAASSLAPQLGSLAASGPRTFLPALAYLAGVAATAAGAFLSWRRES